MHAPRMLSVAFVCMTINLWHAAASYAQNPASPAPAAPAATASPAAAAAPAATAVSAATAPAASTAAPDAGEIGILKTQVAALDRVLEQMQRVDSKIANIAPWIAAAIAVVTAFVTLMPA